MLNPAQELLMSFAGNKMPIDYRAALAHRGTPRKLRWHKKERGPTGFDLTKIKNPVKHLHSFARQSYYSNRL